MRRLRAWFVRLGGLFNNERRERELEEEIESHLHMHIEDNLRSGMTPDEARRDALIKLGGIEPTKENYRHRRCLPALETLLQDLRYGLRMLGRNPGFTAVAVLTLTLGIGANTAIFSVVYSVLLRPLPFKEPDRLVMIFSYNARQDVFHNAVSFDDFADFAAQNEVFEQISGVSPKWSFALSDTGGAEQVFGTWVSANFFPTLGIEPVIGRTFAADEDRPGGAPVVILSHGFGQRRFGSNPDVIGRTLTLDGRSYSIIGVMPPGFRFIEDGEFWVPLQQNPFQARGRNVRLLSVLGRLKAGVSIEQAESGMRTIARRLEQQYPDANTGFSANLIRLHEQVTGTVRPILVVLLGAVGCVLLIACGNVANLMLLRAAVRQREVGVRMALGAARSRLIKQFLTESVLLSLLGAAAGLLLAYWGIQFLLSLGPDLPRLGEIRVDASVLAFTIILSLVTGVLFGLVPAIRASRTDFNEGLKECGRGTSGAAGRQRLRSTLVVSEVALALTLLVASGLLIRSFVRLVDVDPGYITENVVLVTSSVPAAMYPQPRQRLNLYLEIEEKLKAIPGVVSVGAVSRFPLSAVIGSNNVTGTFIIEGRPVPAGERPEVDYRIASTDYFETTGIPLIRGRKFARQDASEVAVINDALARRFWPNEDPIGKRVNFGDPSRSPWVTIVGVVGNVRHLGLNIEPRPEIYRPYPHNPLTGPMIAIRISGDSRIVIPSIRNEIHAIESNMPLIINSIERLVELSVAQRRFSMLLLGVFASMAMILAAVGLYGVMSYSVTQRTHEIGLRMALGAESRQVLQMVVGEGIVLAVAGVIGGVAGALIVTRVMTSLLFGIAATDPFTYIVVSLGLLMVTFCASYLPARRAAKVDPLVALRYE